MRDILLNLVFRSPVFWTQAETTGRSVVRRKNQPKRCDIDRVIGLGSRVQTLRSRWNQTLRSACEPDGGTRNENQEPGEPRGSMALFPGGLASPPSTTRMPGSCSRQA